MAILANCGATAEDVKNERDIFTGLHLNPCKGTCLHGMLFPGVPLVLICIALMLLRKKMEFFLCFRCSQGAGKCVIDDNHLGTFKCYCNGVA